MEARRLPEASVGLEGGVRPVRQPLRGLAAAVAQTLGGAIDAAPTMNRTGQGHPLQTVGIARGRARVAARLAVADHRGAGFHASSDSAARVARAREVRG